MKFLQLQALVQQQRRGVRKCYIAQKTRLGLYFHAHFESRPYNKSKHLGTSFAKTNLQKWIPEDGNRFFFFITLKNSKNPKFLKYNC